ncbi:DUF5955 family protein [Streptomyces sp. YIM 130001]|uniref:DUF5955 family protein n=1 Tax=Streptomyces sp. YIM 130001 TaxID=2259644 RepID=UPI000E648C20|nr:DUF5955 family protein [Streptomyces sp. YIM 130001]
MHSSVRAGGEDDPRVAELAACVGRLRRELAAYQAEFTDRAIAEEELADLHAMTAAGRPEVRRLRLSLLLIAGSIGSVSALAPALAQLHTAVEQFRS